MSKIVVLGVVGFLAVMLALPGLEGDRYSALDDSISEGALGRYGVLQTWPSSCWAWRRSSWRASSSSTPPVGAGRRPLLLVVWSAGVLLCAVFEIDAGAKGEATEAKVHLAAALAAFVAALAAVWLTTLSVRRDAEHAGMFGWSLPLAVLTTLTFLASGAAPEDSSWGGLAQRAFITVLLTWMAAAPWRCPPASRRPRPDGAAASPLRRFATGAQRARCRPARCGCSWQPAK